MWKKKRGWGAELVCHTREALLKTNSRHIRRGSLVQGYVITVRGSRSKWRDKLAYPVHVGSMHFSAQRNREVQTLSA